tara:strand:+ start:3072 stop:3545 length:474 start_codon:yes stop_codon:yes gene_type:complete
MADGIPTFIFAWENCFDQHGYQHKETRMFVSKEDIWERDPLFIDDWLLDQITIENAKNLHKMHYYFGAKEGGKSVYAPVNILPSFNDRQRLSGTPTETYIFEDNEKIRIISNGNVGIGRTAPSQEGIERKGLTVERNSGQGLLQTRSPAQERRRRSR